MTLTAHAPAAIPVLTASADSFFFFSSRRRHTRLQGDWSSDVCSSDLYGSSWPAPAANRTWSISPPRWSRLTGPGRWRDFCSARCAGPTVAPPPSSDSGSSPAAARPCRSAPVCTASAAGRGVSPIGSGVRGRSLSGFRERTNSRTAPVIIPSGFMDRPRERRYSMIKDVRTKILKVIPDERGRLMETLRSDDDMFTKFGQAYITTAYPGVVKGWHYHKIQVDNFIGVKGMFN